MATRKSARQPGKSAKSKKPASRVGAGAKAGPAAAEADEPPIRIAIVGGGCAGLAAAWQLSQAAGIRSARLRKELAPGRQGRVGPRPGRPHPRPRPARLARLLRERVPDDARVLCGGRATEVGARRDRRRATRARLLRGRVLPRAAHRRGRPERRGGVGRMERPSCRLRRGFPATRSIPETNPFTLANYLLRCVDLLKTLMLSVIGPPKEDVPGRPRPERRSGHRRGDRPGLFVRPDPRLRELLIQRIARSVRDGTLTVAAARAPGRHDHRDACCRTSITRRRSSAPRSNLMQALAGQARKELRDFVAIDQKLRWKTEIIDIVMTIAVGLYRDRVLFERARGWMRSTTWTTANGCCKHGATKTAVNSRSSPASTTSCSPTRTATEAAPARCGGRAARRAAHVLHLSRRDVLAHALRDGRCGVRPALQGDAAAGRRRPGTRAAERCLP